MKKNKMINKVLNNTEEKILSKFSKICLNMADNVGASEQICPLFFYEPKKPEKMK